MRNVMILLLLFVFAPVVLLCSGALFVLKCAINYAAGDRVL